MDPELVRFQDRETADAPIGGLGHTFMRCLGYGVRGMFLLVNSVNEPPADVAHPPGGIVL